jgi:hypothetical protein
MVCRGAGGDLVTPQTAAQSHFGTVVKSQGKGLLALVGGLLFHLLFSTDQFKAAGEHGRTTVRQGALVQSTLYSPLRLSSVDSQVRFQNSHAV